MCLTGILVFCVKDELSHRIRNQHYNCTADQRLCFRYTGRFILLENFKLLACFCDCTGSFVSDLVGNTKCWFSHSVAQLQLHVPCPIKIV